jgi:hypothetical protein
MKTIFLYVALIFAFASCKKDDTGIVLNISSAQWHTSTNGGFWNLELILSGSTNADKVKVETHGDGLLGVAADTIFRLIV